MSSQYIRDNIKVIFAVKVEKMRNIEYTKKELKDIIQRTINEDISSFEDVHTVHNFLLQTALNLFKKKEVYSFDARIIVRAIKDIEEFGRLCYTAEDNWDNTRERLIYTMLEVCSGISTVKEELFEARDLTHLQELVHSYVQNTRSAFEQILQT